MKYQIIDRYITEEDDLEEINDIIEKESEDKNE